MDCDPFLEGPDTEHDCFVCSGDEAEDEAHLCAIFSKYPNILAFMPLGGRSILDGYTLINKCASIAGSSLITLTTLPYSFETERRAQAETALMGFPDTVKNFFIIDLQSTVTSAQLAENYNSFLQVTGTFVTHVLGIMARLLESYPFFTYFSDPVYTMAIGSGAVLIDAINDALAHPFYEISPGCGKILVFSDVDAGRFDRDQAVSVLSAKANALPELVGPAGLGPNKVLLLIPTSFRRYG